MNLPESPLYIEGQKSARPGKSPIGNYNHNIFMLLLKAGTDTSLTNVVGDTALHVCARRDNLPCVKALLNYDAKVGSADIKDSKDEEIIRLLKEAASRN